MRKLMPEITVFQAVDHNLMSREIYVVSRHQHSKQQLKNTENTEQTKQ